MDTREKLNLLNEAAGLEVADAFAPPAERGRHDLYPCISHVCAPGGRSVPVIKVLQSNACRNDCHYCSFRAGRDYPRVSLSPDELARSVDLMYRAGVVQGLFLSSGIIDTVKTMDEMLATAELLRGKYAFRGYLHLKLLPAAQEDQVAQAVILADRVSTNLEAPAASRLAFLAPQKHLPELVAPLRTAAKIIARRRAEAPGDDRDRLGHTRLGLSTQFVVGPAGESDRELLTMAGWLYHDVRLTRGYYSAFHPIPDTPLADAAPTDGRRQHRLYQADWLLRYYRFDVSELPFEADGRLNPILDPKTAWARQHPERFPIEVNQAPLDDLLRVPGIGPMSARAIAKARCQGKVQTLGDLRRLGALTERAAPYVLLAGRRPAYQLPLPFEG